MYLTNLTVTVAAMAAPSTRTISEWINRLASFLFISICDVISDVNILYSYVNFTDLVRLKSVIVNEMAGDDDSMTYAGMS